MTKWSSQMSFIVGALIDYLQGLSVDAWKMRDEIAYYIDRCMSAGFCKTEDDVRLCAARYLAGKRRITPPGTARRKRLVKEQAALRKNLPNELRAAVSTVLSANEKAKQQYLAGNEKAINALIGQVMRIYKTDAVIIKELLVQEINE